MPAEASHTTATDHADLPRPVLEVIASKAALPADGGDVDLFVKVTVGFPPVAVDRKPLNLALVIDRSGSMNGEPIEAAKLAAQTAVGMLLPGDWVSVVAFDDSVEVPVPLTRVAEDRRALLDAIAQVGVRGSTNLFGGWAEGLSQVLGCPEAGVVSRVVILSDGRANQGVTDPAAIAVDVGQAVRHGVTTTTMGLSAHYDENLLRTVADAGHGNYVFLEGPAQVVEAFEHELAGLGALRGRDVKLAASGHGVGLRPNAYDRSRGAASSADGEVVLPDLVAGLPIEVVLTLTCAAGAAETSLVLSWDDTITGRRDEESWPLPLAPVDAAAFAALPTDPRVTEQMDALRIAAVKLAIGQAARAGDLTRAHRELSLVERLLAGLPPGENLTNELREVAELKKHLARQDGAMTARYSEKYARDRLYSRSDRNLNAMKLEESELRRRKLAALQEPALRGTSTPSGSQPAARAGIVLYAERIDRPGDKPVDLELVQGDITLQAVDAIVNSSNRGLFGSDGVDGAIHRRAGPALKLATQAIGSISYGEAVFTSGYALPAQYVIHVATPPWGTTGRELQLLAQCYESAFSVADRLGVRSLALPAIGTGAYGYPLQEATRVAATVARGWLTGRGSFETVRFVVFDAAVGRAYLDEIRAWR